MSFEPLIVTHAAFVRIVEAIHQEGDGWHVDRKLRDHALADLDRLHVAFFQGSRGVGECLSCRDERDALKKAEEAWDD